MTRPTEVEWVELNYADQGQGSTSGPTVKVVDMKKRPAWDPAGPVTSVEVMPIEQANNVRNVVRRKTVAGATADPVEKPFRASPVFKDRPRQLDLGKELSAMIVPVNVISITPGKLLTVSFRFFNLPGRCSPIIKECQEDIVTGSVLSSQDNEVSGL